MYANRFPYIHLVAGAAESLWMTTARVEHPNNPRWCSRSSTLPGDDTYRPIAHLTEHYPVIATCI